MATTTTNYNLTKPTMAEIADIRTLNNNMDKVDEVMHSTQVSLAPAYDLTATYNTGDIVMYELLMYKCKEDNVTGAWDASKWERTTAGEEGSGGGGTDVEANPTGTPTDTLDTIRIGQTIYDIAGSGGGGGSAYEETTLWSGSDSATMQLSESFENYDAIMLVGKNTYNNVDYSISGIWLTSYLKAHINDGMRFGLANDSWYVYFSIADETTFTKQDQYSVYINEIKGLKFGSGTGGAGGGLERTLLYTTGSYTIGSPYQQDVPLLDNLSKYDFISVETGTITDNSSGGAKIDVAWFDVSEILQNDVLAHWSGYSTRWWQAVFTDTTFNMTARGSESGSYLHEIFKIFGYKISSGSGGGGYSETSLYTYTGSTRQTTLSLSDAYTDYDAIEFTFGWNLGGSDFETVDVISSSKIVSNVFVNVGGEGRYNYISRGSADDEIILATATGSWDGSSIIREVRGINY